MNKYGRSRQSHLEKNIPYELMSYEQIENFPINDYADSQCDLFLWATHTTLPFCFKLLEKWGFKYHCTITWDKERGLSMLGFHRRTEFCVYAYRGKMGINQKGKFMDTIIRTPYTKHSEKPRLFYSILTRHTQEPRIDIFARKKHQGFSAYGNEYEEPLTLSQFT